MIFAKYQFPDISIWNNLKKSIQSEEAYIDCAVHEIGNICLETDEEGCTKTNPLLGVDILWYSDIHPEFDIYEVFPSPCGIHTFAGCERLYLERFCQFNPESTYCEIPNNI